VPVLISDSPALDDAQARLLVQVQDRAARQDWMKDWTCRAVPGYGTKPHHPECLRTRSWVVDDSRHHSAQERVVDVHSQSIACIPLSASEKGGILESRV
jgi:hypothetical protein